MSHPLLVEAIESEFVPVLVINNQPGKDAEILKRYREPAWNYQVIRFLDGGGKDLIPRKDKVWTIGPLVERMIASLEKARRPVPNYLRAVAEEHATANQSRTAFQQFCFWTGELKLGGLEGVVSTEAGWFGGHEVTLVTWDRTRTDLKTLVSEAEKAQCADRVYVASDAELKLLEGKTRLRAGKLDKSYRAAKASDQKKQLQGTAFAKLKLSPMQATKVNALARTNPKAAMAWLSPKQIAQLKK